MYCVQCIVYCRLASRDAYTDQTTMCTVYCVLCIVYSVLCNVGWVSRGAHTNQTTMCLCTVYCVLCTVSWLYVVLVPIKQLCEMYTQYCVL